MIGALPDKLEVGGKLYGINADMRNVFRIFDAMNDERLYDRSRLLVCVRRLYTEDIPTHLRFEAYEKAREFLDGGQSMSKARTQSVRLVDFEQDEVMLFAAINSVAKAEIRALPFVHWWTFLGYYFSLPPEGLFAQVVAIRSKKAKKQKLEKWEKEFYSANRGIIDLKKRYSAEQREEIDRLNKLLG